MPVERRRYTRIAFDSPATLTTEMGPIEVTVLDLSLKGALIDMPLRGALAPGTLCLLKVVLAETRASIVMSAEVAHVENRHAGLLCRAIDLDSATHLRRLIEFNMGDPRLLERELHALVSRYAAAGGSQG
jgi:hypothetical protein